MNIFSIATNDSIQTYRSSETISKLCGNKPFGSRHWEYPWAIENSGVIDKEGLRILDIAPDFTFPYAGYLRESGHNVTYIDIAKRQWSDKITWGMDRETLDKDLHIMDVCNMSFPDNTFDCIFCISVLEHIVCPTQDPDDPRLGELFNSLAARKALAEMKRCLKPEGIIILTVDIYGGEKWKPYFDKWDIISDLESQDFDTGNFPVFDRDNIFSDPETFISNFYGPYITLGFSIEKSTTHLKTNNGQHKKH